MSPRNIHVTNDFSRVYFIDTEGFQFKYKCPQLAFIPPGLTPSYMAPGSMQAIKAARLIEPRHDEFVLAILIFQILIAQEGYGAMHPFASLLSEEDDNAANRRFPFAEPDKYPVSAE